MEYENGKNNIGKTISTVLCILTTFIFLFCWVSNAKSKIAVNAVKIESLETNYRLIMEHQSKLLTQLSLVKEDVAIIRTRIEEKR